MSTQRIATEESTTRPRVVIIGAGFGGLWAARMLAREQVDVVLIDRNNYHTFFPLLYQVGAAELAPEDIAYPVRSILRNAPRTEFCLAEVQHIDVARRTVITDGPRFAYDYLVVATGSAAHFFGVPGASQHAFTLKSVDQGIALRNHILRCFECALHEKDPDRRRSLLTFAIVGGGPTGVEFAGALTELIRGPLRRDYKHVAHDEIRVVLLEATEVLLAGMPAALSGYARNRLLQMGVEVRFRAVVREITRYALSVKDGSTVSAHTVVWTAGVRGEPAAQQWGLPVARNGCVQVLPELNIDGCPEVFVVGDLAHVEQDGSPLPMIAPVAIQQGVTAAHNILRAVRGETLEEFRYKDPGSMAVIGRNAAVAWFHGHAVSGFPAWVFWLSVHIAKLIGFRNRIIVLVNWAWDYLFFERAVRLILPTEKDL